MHIKNCLCLMVLLLGIGISGCSTKPPVTAGLGEKVLEVYEDVSLFRRSLHFYPAQGKVFLTRDQLLFIPTPYFGFIPFHGKDTTSITLREIAVVEQIRNAYLASSVVEITTMEGKTYSFSAMNPGKLIQGIERIKR